MVMLKNWNTAGHLLEATAERFNKRVDAVLMKNAKLYKEAILQLIEQGDPSWEPKSDRQEYESGTDKLFIGATGTFYSNLDHKGIRRVRAGAGEKRIYVGARYDIRHDPSNMSMERIAEILQNTPYGGARDLFGPAWERVKGQVAANLAKMNVGLNDTDGRGGGDDGDMDS
jgi:hypothetical protein